VWRVTIYYRGRVEHYSFHARLFAEQIADAMALACRGRVLVQRCAR
jgi:hypothetical protein